MLIASTADAIQLAIGGTIGFVLSINLDRFGISLRDPKTRWLALAAIIMFSATFLLLTEPLLT